MHARGFAVLVFEFVFSLLFSVFLFRSNFFSFFGFRSLPAIASFPLSIFRVSWIIYARVVVAIKHGNESQRKIEDHVAGAGRFTISALRLECHEVVTARFSHPTGLTSGCLYLLLDRSTEAPDSFVTSSSTSLVWTLSISHRNSVRGQVSH